MGEISRRGKGKHEVMHVRSRKAHYRRANRLGSQKIWDAKQRAEGVKVTIPKCPWEDKEDGTLAMDNTVQRSKREHTG